MNESGLWHLLVTSCEGAGKPASPWRRWTTRRRLRAAHTLVRPLGVNRDHPPTIRLSGLSCQVPKPPCCPLNLRSVSAPWIGCRPLTFLPSRPLTFRFQILVWAKNLLSLVFYVMISEIKGRCFQQPLTVERRSPSQAQIFAGWGLSVYCEIPLSLY